MKYPVLAVSFLLTTIAAFSQTEGARISGRITDPTDAVIVGVQCTVINLETNVSTTTLTNEEGIYVIPDLRPATYRLTIQKEGFRTVIQPSLQLYVQDAVNENFKLALGSVSETSTVIGIEPLLQTISPAVSTVVDDQFVHNMPLNGRSFQSLIALTPGVVFISADLGAGQFGANGQRSNANYFMVDGVSANFGSSGNGLGQYISGSTPALTSGGGTNALVSVDAMQEFRIQTSSYAPEFGRSNGAQISIVTKSGSNQFHGTAFDYLRNDLFDARNWFNRPPDPKPPLRQNDFGGTFGGPLWKSRTFFFFSYEGLRLLQPQTSTGLFYTSSARAAVAPAYAPFVNAFPVPTAPPIDSTCDNLTHPCLAPLTVAYSNPATIDATSIRLDHHLNKQITVFGRYNHSPTHGADRSWEELSNDYANTDTLTVGATFAVASDKLNDFRANWSRNTGSTIYTITNFHGGIAPPDSVVFPASTPFRFDTSQAHFYPPDGTMDFREGTIAALAEKQLNFVDTFSWTAGSHQLKFGIDYRRINTSTRGNQRIWSAGPPAFSFIVAGTLPSTFVLNVDPISINTNNYSLFGQDTWRATNRLTVTYGLRWEINTPPQSATAGKPLYIVQGVFDSKPITVVRGAPWNTRFGNPAPRFGVAYHVTPKTVVRGGLGLFYDLGYGDTGDLSGIFPYVRSAFRSGPVPFDPSNPIFQPVPFSTTIDGDELVGAADPNLRLPFTTQWNAAIEREIGPHQSLTATYLGSDGKRLPRQDTIRPPAFVSGGAILAFRNAGNSRYDAFQAQFQRRFSHGLQALASYTLSKSTDAGSSDRDGVTAPSVSEVVLPPLTPSDFDIRHTLAGAVSYEIPAPVGGRIVHTIAKGWGVDGLLRVTSAWPLNVTVGAVSPVIGQYATQPDIVPGQPFWLPAPEEPGAKVLNPAAFTPPPVGQTGNFPRNGLRVPFSINQTDFAVWRRFGLTERVKLQIRAEYFNVFNHPMFNAPGQSLSGNYWGTTGNPNPYFGKLAANTTNNALNGVVGGGQNPLYAIGGPRSGQFMLKLMF
jgi:hypothetical protein